MLFIFGYNCQFMVLDKLCVESVNSISNYLCNNILYSTSM